MAMTPSDKLEIKEAMREVCNELITSRFQRIGIDDTDFAHCQRTNDNFAFLDAFREERETTKKETRKTIVDKLGDIVSSITSQAGFAVLVMIAAWFWNYLQHSH